MKKALIKTLSVLLTLLVVAGTLAAAPVTVNAAVQDHFEYTVLGGGAKITGYHNSSIPRDFVIPDTLGGYPVTEIDGYIFSDFTGVYFSGVSLTLPDTIVRIGAYAFEYCDNLRTLKLSSSLVSIGEGAFAECRQLESLTIPASLTYIGDRALPLSNPTDITGRNHRYWFIYVFLL